MIQDQKPQRACRMRLDLQGDTRQDVADALRNIAFDLERGELTSGCSGGYSSGYTYTYTESDSPTHDEFVQALNEYVEGLRK